MPDKPSSDPTPENAVDFAGLVGALGLDPKEFNREEEKPSTEESEVTAEGDVPAVEEEEEQQTLESTQPGEEEKPEAEEEKEEETEKQPKEDELSPAVQKRIDKLTAEKYQAREELETVRSQLAQAQQKLTQGSSVPAPSTIPLGDVNSHGELEQAKEQALQVKEWALQNPDGGSYKVNKDGKEEEVFFSAEQVRGLLVNASRMLDRDIPARKQWLDDAQVSFAEARQLYPQLFDSNHPDAKLALQMLDKIPEIKRFSDFATIIGDYFTGARVRMERMAKAKGQPATGKVIPMPPGGKPKVIGSPKGQAGGKPKVAKTVSEVAKVSSDLSISEAADLLDAFIT